MSGKQAACYEPNSSIKTDWRGRGATWRDLQGVSYTSVLKSI